MPIYTYAIADGTVIAEVMQMSRDRAHRNVGEIDLDTVTDGTPEKYHQSTPITRVPSAPGSFGRLSTPGRKN